MLSYVCEYLSRSAFVSKKNNQEYYTIDIQITISDGDAIIRSYTTTLFVNKEQYDLAEGYKCKQLLDTIFIPNRNGRLSLLQLDIAE